MDASYRDLSVPVATSPSACPVLDLESGGPLVVVANRLPVQKALEGGREVWAPSPGGLVSALAPIVRDTSGTWVGWSGRHSRDAVPFRRDGMHCVPVEIASGEIEGFYSGFCNATLWPLYHHAVRQPRYSRSWWDEYVAVNRRFAARVAETAPRCATVWVHDYHLQLVPALLRDLRPDVGIGFFLHTPFPHHELFRRLPWRTEILKGLLGADVVGFQTPASAANFRELALEQTGSGGGSEVWTTDGRRVHVGAFPISIDTSSFEALAADPKVVEEAAEIRRRLGRGRRLVLGVDRLDYTKGIDLRLEAFHEWLRRTENGDREAVLVQVAVPSREDCAGYRALRQRVEGLVGQINGDFGDVGHAPVHYLRRSLPTRELVALYRAADVMLVTPLCDGMNLVAKEFVASRSEDDGVLVLSEFAGAAAELDAALIVNPHDPDGMCAALDRALSLGPIEMRRRMRSMKRAVRRHTIQDWATSFLAMLARSDRSPDVSLAGLA